MKRLLLVVTLLVTLGFTAPDTAEWRLDWLGWYCLGAVVGFVVGRMYRKGKDRD